jgi:hypothetical protein
MDQRDPTELFTSDRSHPVRGAFPVAILGNLETRTFELIQLLDIPPDLHQMIEKRNLCFVGFVGIVDGVPRSALELPIDSAAVADILAAYLQIIETEMNRLEISMIERMRTKPFEYDA